ncbi:Glutamate decarboxylase 3 [Bienertia sinuspersici]
MPQTSMPKEEAQQIINDELMLDGNPQLNLASFVTTWMEPECDKLMMDAINKNCVEMNQYPVTTELQNRCLNMIARMFNAPLEDSDSAVGAGTVSSSEAIMLAGIAFKRRWQNKRKYFEVEVKQVKLREGCYVMDLVKAVEMVDENTIGVVAILGSTLNGEFEDVKLLNDLVLQKNKETGWDTPIHVDAASGGFIAPFLYPELEWDFRLPLVKSINVSSHKYDLVYAGIGWIVWRTKEDLPEELYYQLIRLGFEGYQSVMKNCQENAISLKGSLDKIGRFNIVSKDNGLPLVAFSLKDNTHYNEFEVSDMLRRFGWIVPAYTMPADARHVTLLRVVVRRDFSRTLAERLMFDITKVLNELDQIPCKNCNT